MNEECINEERHDRRMNKNSDRKVKKKDEKKIRNGRVNEKKIKRSI